MKENLVSFKLAKLAKEKGFNEECLYTYYDYKSMYKRLGKNKQIEKDLFKIKLSCNKNIITVKKSEILNGRWEVESETYIRYYDASKLFQNNNLNKNDYTKHWYSAPTQSSLQKWIREKYNIHCSVWYNKLTGKYRPELMENKTENEIEYKTYEKALEIELLEKIKTIE